jgi:hypothetical protein
MTLNRRPLLTALRVSVSFLTMSLIITGICFGLSILAYIFA